MTQVIAICGNVAAGKTTVCSALRVTGWEIVEEQAEENRYLPAFYQDMRSWAFHSQLTFLTNKFLLFKDIEKRANRIAFDRHIVEDSLIFEASLHEAGLITEQDHATYRSVFDALMLQLPPIACYVLVDASVETLMTRITKRGRFYEQGIDQSYIQSLQRRYDAWLNTLPPERVVRLDSDLKNVANRQVVDWLEEEIERKISG